MDKERMRWVEELEDSAKTHGGKFDQDWTTHMPKLTVTDCFFSQTRGCARRLDETVGDRTGW